MPSKGFEPGWLISILAPPKHYKTTFCINLALNICAQGRPVLYYPCEITQKLAAVRTLSKLTDRTIDYLRKDPKGLLTWQLRRPVTVWALRCLSKDTHQKL